MISQAHLYSPSFLGLINCMDADYFADPGINNSGLQCILKKSPYHFKMLNQSHDRTTEALRIGTLVHALTLGYPAMDYFITWSGASFTSKAYKEFKAENTEGYHVLESELETATKIYNRASSSSDLIKDMQAEMNYAEVSCFVDRFGYRGKAKADALKINDDHAIIWDVKTTADLFKFSYSARDYGYHMQRAWYCLLFEEFLGLPVDYRLLVVEKNYPNTVVEYGFSDRVIAEGRAKIERAFSIYVACLDSDVWHGPKSKILLDWRT